LKCSRRIVRILGHPRGEVNLSESHGRSMEDDR
jgi:hypothetical protein